MSDTDERRKQTFNALRLATVALVSLLALSVIVEVVFGNNPWCLQHSISAYFYTPSRAVFVGALCAIGICLMVYQGNGPWENLLLDFVGFMAFVVAFVPTDQDDACHATNVPTDAEVTAAVENNMGALFVVAIILAVRALVTFSEVQAKLFGVVPVVLLLAGFLVHNVAPKWFENNAHYAAAIPLFVVIVIVVIINAVQFDPDEGQRNWYPALAAVMGIGGIAMLVAGLFGFLHWIFVAEALLITLFAVFWALQTKELKDKVDRDE